VTVEPGAERVEWLLDQGLVRDADARSALVDLLDPHLP